MKDVVSLVGRLMLCAIFVWAGINKAMAHDATVAYFTKLALLNPPLAYFVTVAVEALGGLAILVGWQTRWVALVLAIWCLATAYVGHWNFADRNQTIHLMKNIAIAGGFLQLSVLGAGRWSFDKT